MIYQNVNINQEDTNGNTPLHIASYEGHLEIVKFLINSGARLLEVNIWQYNALHVVSQNGHLEIAKLLIEKGVPIDLTRFRSGETCLHIASQNGHFEIVKLLVEKGADINTRKVDIMCKTGATALFIACEKGHFEIAKLLVASGAKINIWVKYGTTPLHVAALYGYHNIVELLVENGADLNAKDDKNKTPSQLGNNIIVKLYLKWKMTTNNKENSTPGINSSNFFKNAKVKLNKLRKNQISVLSDLLNLIKQNCFIRISTNSWCNFEWTKNNLNL